MMGDVLTEQTASCGQLTKVQVYDLVTSVGLSRIDVDTLQSVFRKLADTNVDFGESDKLGLSLKAFQVFVDGLTGTKLRSDKYYMQFHYAFNQHRNEGFVNFQDLLMGLLVSDSEIGRDIGSQLFRCRLEIVFSFYDCDQDGKWNHDDFGEFVRHLVRNKGEDYQNLEHVRMKCMEFAKAIPGPKRDVLGMEEFVDFVHTGILDGRGYDSSTLVRLPPFRSRLRSLAVPETQLKPALKQPNTPTTTALVSSQEQEKTRQRRRSHVRLSFGCNTIIIPQEGEGRTVPENLRSSHAHSKNKSTAMMQL